MQDQWKKKNDVHMRRLDRRGLKMHDEGDYYDDSGNAELFWIVE